MSAYDVLVTGTVSVDVIFPPIANPPNPGEEIYCDDLAFTCGASYNTAVALSRLGMNVAIAAPIGNDFLSKFILEKLESEGVSTVYMKRFDQPLRTLSVALNYGGDRSFVSYEDPLENFNFENYVSSVAEELDVKVLHIEANHNAIPIMEVAKRKGVLVSLDVGWNESWLQDPLLKKIISLGDFFTPNLKEALKITNQQSLEKAFEDLQGLNTDNKIIVKLDKEGAFIKERGKLIKVPSTERSPVDTTGAGDVFVAGVLAGLLKGFSFIEAVKIGNFCGGCSVEGLGGGENSPTWERVSNEIFENENGGN